jgi:hypothetical protein
MIGLRGLTIHTRCFAAAGGVDGGTATPVEDAAAGDAREDVSPDGALPTPDAAAEPADVGTAPTNGTGSDGSAAPTPPGDVAPTPPGGAKGCAYAGGGHDSPLFALVIAAGGMIRGRRSARRRVRRQLRH